MKNLIRSFLVVALLGLSANANAWWWGPGWGDGWGDGWGGFSFGFSLGGGGWNRWNHWGHPYHYGYPYQYGPYAYQYNYWYQPYQPVAPAPQAATTQSK